MKTKWKSFIVVVLHKFYSKSKIKTFMILKIIILLKKMTVLIYKELFKLNKENKVPTN